MKRPSRPSLRVERDVLLVQLFGPGTTRADVDLDHEPALGLRVYDEATGTFDPPADDPAFLVFRPKADHAAKTRGTGATTAGSDIGKITKLRNLTEQQVEFRARMLAKAPGKPRQKSGKIPSRPFQRRKPMNGTVERRT